VFLKPSPIRGLDLIRLAEAPQYLFGNERFRLLFTSGGFTGFGFAEVAIA
jgi:hypothetical protein